MNKKRIITVLSIIMLAVFLTLILSPNIYASSLTADSIKGQADNFINQGANSAKVNVNEIASIMKPLASLLLGIGTVVLLIVTAVMGVKYMTASPEERAKLKTQLIGIAISAVVLYGAYGIWSIAYTVMTELTA